MKRLPFRNWGLSGVVAWIMNWDRTIGMPANRVGVFETKLFVPQTPAWARNGPRREESGGIYVQEIGPLRAQSRDQSGDQSPCISS